MEDVEGKTAFVTGGDSGIGLGIARALVDAGMKVAITYRTVTHLNDAMKVLEHAESRVHAVNLDVTDRAAVAAAAEETVRVFGNARYNQFGLNSLASLRSSGNDLETAYNAAEAPASEQAGSKRA